MGGFRLMKKILIYILALMLLLTSCGKPDAKTPQQPPPGAKVVKEKPEEVTQTAAKSLEKLRAVSLLSTNNLDLNDFTSSGFNTVILSTYGVRQSKNPYKTDNKALNKLDTAVSEINNSKTDYILDITSGPGLSSDGKITTIFDNRQEAMYFARMTKEIIKRYDKNEGFKGISINIGTQAVAEEKYYDTLNYIISKIREDYKDVHIIYNLHPLAFENNFKILPDIKHDNILLNAPISLNGITYPGFGAGVKNSIKLNKNTILEKLQKLKPIHDGGKINVITTIKIPWIAKSEVLVQDMFEITKILGYDFNLCYGNSGDIFDFTKNQSILKIVKRHNN
jgi:hypothetical protein